jgi:neutral ceramidase
MNIPLKAGASRSVITPPLGTLLFGYAPPRPGESVHDDLTVSALALESGDVRALLVSATISIFDNDKTDLIRGLVAEATGYPVDAVLLCSTHTHSAPETASVAGWSEINRSYYADILEPAVLKAAVQAVEGLKPVRMGIGTTRSDVGVNRRQLNRDGSVTLGQNPWGPYDPCMTFLRFLAEDGPVASLIHYGAHATAAGYSREITRDWPGPMVDRLEQVAGGITLFFNGAIGDVGPRLSNGQTTADMDLMRELGGKAAWDAVSAFRTIKEYRSVDLDRITEAVSLPYAPLPSLEQAREALAGFADPDRLAGMERAEHAYWDKVVDEHAAGRALQDRFQFRQTLVRLGPVVLVPFPNEFFVEISLRLRDYSPYPFTLCLSNANGSYAYLPSQEQRCRGGYEIEAVKLCNTYLPADDADQAAVRENLRLLDALKAMESRASGAFDEPVSMT